nr:hypothetical protein [Tanacetum cinerariifolium]
MTKADKELLLHFVTRISMYIHPKEASSVVNFITGYEIGTRDECDFTEQLKQLLSDKYKVDYSSDGWTGQIKRLAKRRHSTWLILFRRLTLELIVNDEGDGLDETQQAFLKAMVIGRLEQLMEIGTVGFREYWVEDWLSLCTVKSSWFKQ